MYPATMRFTTIDPLAEKYYSISPYAYCANNPILFIDPDGKRVKPAPKQIRPNQNNRYALYPNQQMPLSIRTTTTYSSRATSNGAREQISEVSPSYIKTVNTGGGNTVQQTPANRDGKLATSLGEAINHGVKYKAFLKITQDLIYSENQVKKESNIVILDPDLAQKQSTFDTALKELNDNLGPIETTNSLEFIQQSVDRVQEVVKILGESPIMQIQKDLFQNSKTYKLENVSREIIPEYRKNKE